MRMAVKLSIPIPRQIALAITKAGLPPKRHNSTRSIHKGILDMSGTRGAN